MNDRTNDPASPEEARGAERSGTTGRFAVWQTEPCPDWCRGGHVDNEHPEDREHRSNPRGVSVHLMRAVDFGEPSVHDWRLAGLRAMLCQPDSGGRTHIYSDDIDEKPVQLDLTCEEARALASALLDLDSAAGAGTSR